MQFVPSARVALLSDEALQALSISLGTNPSRARCLLQKLHEHIFSGDAEPTVAALGHIISRQRSRPERRIPRLALAFNPLVSFKLAEDAIDCLP
jgi:hypothetical protein